MSHLAIEDLQHPGCELRRIYLPGTRVNRGKEKSRTAEERSRRRFVIMRCDGTLLRDDGHKTRRPTAAGRSAREHRARGHPPLR
jgi:hypothetical protein